MLQLLRFLTQLEMLTRILGIFLKKIQDNFFKLAYYEFSWLQRTSWYVCDQFMPIWVLKSAVYLHFMEKLNSLFII